MKKAACIVGLGFLLLAFAAPASAQKYEFGISWSFFNPSLDTTYLNHYAPPYLSGGTYVSNAQQTLQWQGGKISGLSAVINFFPTAHFGIQFLADYLRPPLKGTNSAYALSLTYQRPMPDQTTTTTTYTNSSDWADTDGNYRQIVLSLNGIFRIPLTKSLSLNVSGGPSYFYTESNAGYIGYTEFWTSADRLLHIQTYSLAYDTGTQAKLGFNIGGELAIHLSSLIAVTGEYRYFKCAKSDTALHLTATDLITGSLADVEQSMNLGKISFDPSYARFSAGIKFMF